MTQVNTATGFQRPVRRRHRRVTKRTASAMSHRQRPIAAGNLQSAGFAAGARVTAPAENASYEELLRLDETIVTKGLTAGEVAQRTTEQAVTQQFLRSMQSTKETDCKICLCDFETDERIRRLPCLHVFHANCIDAHFKTKRNCPICREEVL